MEDKRLIAELENFDFSRCHMVREKLLAQLNKKLPGVDEKKIRRLLQI